ncbi:Eco57I restriction-modification methylase domain-containing protein [Petrimonas mucosa]|uniref:site-specific DNA-methyltransferase (adenine-specific) n=1 Tax=Petrimonas mucosa TaxID=1642646 RepID=A0A1G4G4E0_9BACT|nr:Eco57I restriction-modification methylase domain-containing protein [Petrimonas mucosa]SCM55784.1 putative adenine-specific methylase MPN_111 [Petrimonas mucosa]
MIQTNYNPDVLSCLANLSNDEVFTPPGLVNDILDLLPAELWSNPNAKFLDPVSKSGVFLREMAKRLMHGLETQIPDKQERINHIFSKQLYGIAITELTSLLSRRSVYCSKTANGKYSICETFDNEQGNIYYERMQHTWQNGKCTYCGASQEVYDREDALETYAYNFIHTDKPEKIFNMKFDVIVGNPPYQMSDGGGRDSGAISLYHKFIEQAKKLNPRYLSMIVPARWYSGGKGLDEFRDEMLKDKRLAQIHDFPETSDCFPGLNIRGGVCYFLWDREHKGDCTITNYKNGTILSTSKRPLLEPKSDVFVRYNEAIDILRKVKKFNEKTFDETVSARKPFGLDSNFSGFKKSKTDKHNILLYRFGDNGFVSEEQVIKNKHWVNEIKVLVSKASPGGDSYPHQIISKPIVADKMSCCTETYLVVGIYKNKKIAENVAKYMHTRFFRFMMSLIKNTQNISRGVFAFVPIQDFNEEWTDEKLFAKYGITASEIKFIDTLIRPME